MASGIMDSKDAQYYKLPFFALIHFLLKDDTIKNALDFDAMKSLISNMYIYAFLFTSSNKSKNKTMIAHDVLDKIYASNKDTIKDVLITLKAVRRKFLDSFELFRNFNIQKGYAMYSIMDYYVANDNFIEQIYSLQNDYTPEHFLISNNKFAEVKWQDATDSFSFSLKELLGNPDGRNYKSTAYKKQMSNYLILPKKLNEEIEHDDIISKIENIKERYAKSKNGIKQVELPTHIELFINHIEAMQTYATLKGLKGNCGIQEDIKKAYKEFINDYFSDENQASLYRKLELKFKTVFNNH
jgi:hypothetical protein